MGLKGFEAIGACSRLRAGLQALGPGPSVLSDHTKMSAGQICRPDKIVNGGGKKTD